MKRGYVPDGKGVYHEEKVCKSNDKLTLCLTKDL